MPPSTIRFVTTFPAPGVAVKAWLPPAGTSVVPGVIVPPAVCVTVIAAWMSTCPSASVAQTSPPLRSRSESATGLESPTAPPARLETPEGPVFYDINANSNLRLPIGQAFGFDPFERVVDYLERELAKV